MTFKDQLIKILDDLIVIERKKQTYLYYLLIKIKKSVEEITYIEKEQIGNIKYVGEKIKNMIEKRLTVNKSKVKQSSEVLHQQNEEQDKIIKRKRKYVPKYLSANYILLQALFLNRDNVNTKGSLMDYLKENLPATYDSKYSPWSGMKRLIANELVEMNRSDRTYALTTDGLILSYRLFKDRLPMNLPREVKLLIDNREIKNKQERTFFQEQLSDLKIETRNLILGDFLWTVKIDSCEFVLNHIIERKTISDFTASIIDGRLNEQKNRLLNSNIKNVYYIIEGPEPANKNISEEIFSEKLNQLKLEKFQVFETENVEETILLIRKLHEKILREGHLAEKNKLIFFNEFNLRSNKNEILTDKMLLYLAVGSIYGITSKIAEKISKEYLSVHNFYAKIKCEKFLHKISELEFEEGKTVGIKNARKIVRYFKCVSDTVVTCSSNQ